ncbi:MAG TPA: tetratricopeptide repeat protein [Methylomirabilota bacterium]|jgi:tetratricopeptide (TPR) repeat protein
MSPRVLRSLVMLSALLMVAALARAEDPVESARALMASWHEDRARIDRARAILETAAAARPSPGTLVELSRAWFLTGDIRSRSDAEKLAAYEHGREAARRAITAAPGNDMAHLWLALNTGRYAETRGFTAGLTMLSSIREASDTALRLNPKNVDALILAGGILANVPRLMGGDRAKAEAHFKRALELDPHKTSARIELADLYMDTKRWAEARRELQQVVDESAPTDLPRWTVSELPRARRLLAEIAGRDPRPGQSP